MGAISVSPVGILYGVMSSMFVALYAVYVKKALPAVNDNTWLLMIYNNLNAALVPPPTPRRVADVAHESSHRRRSCRSSSSRSAK